METLKGGDFLSGRECTRCQSVLKKSTLGMFDTFGFLGENTPHYCENKDCEHFGLLTVAAMAPKKENTKQVTQVSNK